MDLTSCLFSLILFSFTILTLHKLLSKPTQKLPPGPPKLPLVGNLQQLAAKNVLPHHRLAQLAKSYGPIMMLQLGQVPTLIISSAHLAKEVLKTHDAVLCSKPILMVPKVLYYDSSDIALAPYGEYWRQVRKIATLELFTTKRVSSFRSIRDEEVADFVNDIATQAGSVVNLSEKIFALMFDITSRITMNRKGKEQEEFRKLAKDITALCSGFSIGDLYPSVQFIYSLTGMKRRLLEIVKRSDQIMDPIIKDHMSIQRQDQNADYDMVDVLLRFHKDNPRRTTDFALSTDNIKAIILELFAAGSETGSTIIEWTISELLKNPRTMKKAQDEVRQIYKGNELIDETTMEELKYIKLVLKETLRLHPPSPLLLRESMENCQIHGYDIPRNTRMFINVWGIGRDTECWEDAEQFIPERFENSSVDFKGNDFELIPFGAGRRICPGMALGLANVELALAKLIYHFDWKLPNEMKPEELNMEETFGIVASRKNELLVIPIPFK
ncbi:cytochrome P450 71D8-like [Silene latifolia]|uniref:cytochrome P450 71D8-like n=1 Tax=Silene latifolia TaxID=37657 RepID=UPI003D780BB6